MVSTAVNREKYLNHREVMLLRAVTEPDEYDDLRAGYTRGVLAWMIVDLALQTGQRVSEMVRLVIGDYDVRRQALKVWRHKRSRRTRETIALSDTLAAHLRRFIS